jgi:TolB-like protein/DNA-binding winged helix-turn-helix (wHTH) protein/Flp pilus assembly protein TadD
MAVAMQSDPQTVRFGTYTVSLQSGELYKNGIKIKLPEQSFQILTSLLERPGDVVTRKELEEKLWPDGTVVDYEHSVNAALKRLREALNDSADNPRFVETLPRRGYRFIAPVERPGANAHGWLWAVGLAALPAVVVLLLALNIGGLRDRLLGRPLPGEITSIAVLPLHNLSGDPEQEYFADGMTEALLTELGKIGALRVISRQSVMQFKDSEKPLPEIARELNVDAIIEGSAVREGERVRITMQLIQATPEQHLWAESYERDFTSVLGLQGEMARAIARQIRITVTPEEAARLASARPVNPEAQTAYLKGRYYWNQRTEDAIRKSLDYFQQAIARDPNYALAYSGLADAYNVGFNYGYLAREENFSRSKEAALRALELDDTLAEAHASLSFILGMELDWAGEGTELQRALELNPNYASAHQWYSFHLAMIGRDEEALAEAKKALVLDPVSLQINVSYGILFWNMRRYDEAIEQCLRTIELDPDYFNAYSWLGRAYEQKGMYEEAISSYQKAVALAENQPVMLSELGHGYAVAGRRAEALEILEELKELAKKKHVPPDAFGIVYTALGDKDKAFHWLERQVEEEPWGWRLLKVDPWMDPLRSDPRFHSLLRRMNLPE